MNEKPKVPRGHTLMERNYDAKGNLKAYVTKNAAGQYFGFRKNADGDFDKKALDAKHRF